MSEEKYKKESTIARLIMEKIFERNQKNRKKKATFKVILTPVSTKKTIHTSNKPEFTYGIQPRTVCLVFFSIRYELDSL